jgi:hypothetical protein
MVTHDPIQHDDSTKTTPAAKSAKALNSKDEKRELADTEVSAISAGGNINNPPPVAPAPTLP